MFPLRYRAVALRAPGGIENFYLTSRVIESAPRARRVVVKVDACAVAYRDCLDRRGAFPFIKPDVVLGHEFAGTVVAAGPEAKRFALGDRVVSLHWNQDAAWPSPLKKGGAVDTMFALTCDGGYAEACEAEEGAFARAPPHLSATEASCVVSTFGTVWHAAVSKARMTAGQRVLVTGASGGVGSAAVLIAKALGCHVTAVTSSNGKKPFLETLGCDDIIVAPDSKFKVPALSDVVVESVGVPTFSSSLRACAPGGRLVLLGNVSNGVAELPLGFAILNSISVIGSDSIPRAEFESELVPFMAKHNIRPLVQDVVPLSRVADAHTAVEGRHVQGRLVLDTSK